MLDITSGTNLTRGWNQKWSDETEQKLRELWPLGLSASRMSVMIGGVSRCAVIGKARRLGLPPRGGTMTVQERAIRGKESARRYYEKTGKRKQQERRASVPRVIEPPPPSVDDLAIPIEQRRSLLQLTNYCCHWPVNDPGTPEFFFCGSTDMRDGSSYCRSHYARSVQPPRVRA